MTIHKQSQGLHQTLLPVLSSSTSLQKKIDYVWNFQPKAQRCRASLQLAESGRIGDIAQSNDGLIAKKIPLLYGAEIKRAGGDELESRA